MEKELLRTYPVCTAIRPGQGLLLLFAFFFLLGIFPAYAQTPPDFILHLSKTDETCLGNGSISFTVENTSPLATIEYRIYELPDVVNAIAVLTTTNTLNGLTVGTYRVVAKQTLNGNSNTQTGEISITSNIVPLDYTVTGTNAVCGSDGVLSITINQGSGALYEIISGPVVRPPQASASFGLLPAGEYQIRITDNCGDGYVTTFTLFSDAVQINISEVNFPENILPACDQITISNSLTPAAGGTIPYPLTIIHTIYPPGGGTPIVLNSTVPGGDPESYDVKVNIPFYYDQTYTYDLMVIDNCGNQYPLNNNIVRQKLELGLGPNDAGCGTFYLMVTVRNYFPPLTINFSDFPTGFDAVAMNPLHPGPFPSEPIPYGGDGNPVPFGEYAASVTDGCGRSDTNETELVPPDIDPIVTIIPYVGCLSNQSTVKILLSGYDFVFAEVTAAPTAYGQPLPHDVTAQITQQFGLVLEHLPLGDYMVHLIDDCGNPHDVPFTVVPGPPSSVTVSTRADCDANTGSVRIRGSFTELTSVTMISAPTAFTQPLPYPVSFNITTSPAGIFSMRELPPGNYVFKATDNCGSEHPNIPVTIPGYTVTTNTYAIIPHCGSFDLTLAHTSNGNAGQSFWLQKKNPVTGLWGHPATNVVYVEGSPLDGTNSLSLLNNATTFNIAFIGDFRIIKRFESFENGSIGQYKSCIEPLHEFTFNNDFDITDIRKITCSGQLSDVEIIANGVPPMIYEITHKNGVPFSINNGTNNIFTNLEPALYHFQVTQACNDFRGRDRDIAELPSLANANQPDDLTTCDDSSSDGIEEFDLTSQDAIILGSQNAADFTLTYHTSLPDAEAGTNAITDTGNYNSPSHTIYARLKHNSSVDCFDIVSFELVVEPYPVLQMATTWAICEGSNVTITADAGLDSYLWSTGQTTRSITVSAAGTYTLEVTEGNCTGNYSIDVVPSNSPEIDDIQFTDWTDNDNTITVVLSQASIGDYVFSLDNINFQEDNTFYGLASGPYTIYVKDRNGCDPVSEEVFLLNYPKFFTPNEDGYNDYWRVRYSEREPHMQTYIFDRYGKLITGFLPDSRGWDGMLNGMRLPSTDYWFLIIRENGRQLRGHFAMKR